MVRNPGSRGGRWYLHNGKVVYGEPGKLPKPPAKLLARPDFNDEVWRMSAALAVKNGHLGNYSYMSAAYLKMLPKIQARNAAKLPKGDHKTLWHSILNMLGLHPSTKVPDQKDLVGFTHGHKESHQVDLPKEGPVSNEEIEMSLLKDIVTDTLKDAKIRPTQGKLDYVLDGINAETIAEGDDADKRFADLNALIHRKSADYDKLFTPDGYPENGTYFYINPALFQRPLQVVQPRDSKGFVYLYDLKTNHVIKSTLNLLQAVSPYQDGKLPAGAH